MSIKYVFNPTTGNLDATDKVAFNGEVNAGSAASPSIFFTGDPNTGIYSPGADQLAISTGGSGRLFVDANGKVGILRSPQYELDVLGSARLPNSAWIYFNNAAGSAQQVLTVFSDNSTYLDAASGGDIVFRPNASQERARLTSTGRLGVGTSSASTNVEINAALDTGASVGLNEGQLSIGREANSGGAIRIGYDTTNNFGFISSGRVGTSWDRLILNAGGGNVSVGTSSSANSFQVAYSALAAVPSSGASGHNFSVGSIPYGIAAGALTNGNGYFQVTRWDGTATNYDLLLQPNGGRVGIGSTTFDSPAAGRQILEINGTSSTLVNLDTGGTRRAYWFTDATDTYLYNTQAGSLLFGANNAERARIDSSGRLLVGTSSWSKTGRAVFSANSVDNLETYVYFNRGTAATATDSSIAFLEFTNGGTDTCARISCSTDAACGSGDSPGRLVFSTTADGASSPTERMRITSSGQTQWSNAVTPVLRVENPNNVSGDGVADLILRANAGNTSSYHLRGNTNSVGNWYLYGNGTTSYSSDQRLKKNIETTRDGYLADICQLRVVKYNWNSHEDGAPKELGLIAQEVEQVFPGLVQEDLSPLSDDDPTLYKQLKGSVLPVILLKALQEAAEKIETLEAKVAALESA